MSLFHPAWLLAFKSTALLLGIWLSYIAFSRFNPRWQVWSIRIGLVGLLLLVITALVPPLIRLPVALNSSSEGAAAIQPRNYESASTDRPANDSTPVVQQADMAANIPAEAPIHSRPMIESDSTLALTDPAKSVKQPTLAALEQLQSTQRPRIDATVWATVAVFVWAAGVCIACLRWLLGWWRMRAILKAAQTADGTTLTLVRDISRRLGICSPRVVTSQIAHSPSVLGIRRAIVLLPEAKSSQLSQTELKAAIAHELAHVMGGDLRWHAFVRFVAVLFWPHPLLWRLSYQHRSACERVSDLTAADLLEDRQCYAQQLLSVALRSRNSPQFGLSMARSPEVLTRMRALASDVTAGRLGAAGKLVAIAVLLVAAGLGTTETFGVIQAATEKAVELQGSTIEQPIQESNQENLNQTDANEANANELGANKSEHIVLSPDGTPAINAKVYLGVGQGPSLQFSEGYEAHGHSMETKTDSSGRFELSTDKNMQDGIVAIVHDSGYLEISLEQLKQSQQFQLEQWARLEFEVNFDGGPAAGEHIMFLPKEDLQYKVRIVGYGLTTQTDQRGFAVLDRVVPRTGYVGMAVVQSTSQTSHTQYGSRGYLIHLKPGETRKVSFGGSGRGVAGRVVLPENLDVEHSWQQNEAGLIETAGVSHDDPSRRGYRFLFEDDGSFRFPNLPRGKYTISSKITNNRRNLGLGKALGQLKPIEFEVTEDSSVDQSLGVLQAEWLTQIGRGAYAKNFVAKSANNAVSLDELGGKLVLLDFWASRFPNSTDHIRGLNELYSRFQGEVNLVKLSVATDDNFDSALKFAETNQVSGIVIHGPMHGMLTSGYDVNEMPVTFLIGPDGMILYRGNDLDLLARNIAKQLEKKDQFVPNASKSNLQAQPFPIGDRFAGSQHPCDLIIAYPEPLSPSESPNVNAQGLFMHSANGELLRHLPMLSPDGWLKHPDRVAMDRKRGQIYLVDNDKLHCFSTDCRLLYGVELPSLHAIAVEPASGDVWCLCSSHLNLGWTVVLDSNGHQKRMMPLAGFTLRYSPVDKGFWYVGKQATLVSPAGEILASHSLPDNAFCLSAVSIDPQGGCWAIEQSADPETHEQLWRITSKEMKRIGDFGSVNFNTRAGNYLQGLAVNEQGAWVGVVHSDGDLRLPGQREIRCYDRQGKLVKQLAGDLRILGDDYAGNAWMSEGKQVRKIGSDSPPVSFECPAIDLQRFFQPIWFAR